MPFEFLSTGDRLFVDVDGQVCDAGNSNAAPGAAKWRIAATGTLTLL